MGRLSPADFHTVYELSPPERDTP